MASKLLHDHQIVESNFKKRQPGPGKSGIKKNKKLPIPLREWASGSHSRHEKIERGNSFCKHPWG
jgi:hypothetical protein